MDGQGDPYYSTAGDPDWYLNPPNGTRFNPHVSNLIPTPPHPQPPSWNPAWNGLPSYTQSQFQNFGYAQNRFPNPPYAYAPQYYIPPFVPPHLRVRPNNRKPPQTPVQTQNIPCLLSIKFNKKDFSSNSNASKKHKAEALLPKPGPGKVVESTSAILGDSVSPASSSLNKNVPATTGITSPLSTGTIEGQHRIGDKNNSTVSTDVAADKNYNDQLTPRLCDGFVTETNETNMSDGIMDSSNNGAKKAKLSNLPTSSTFRQRSNSDSSDRTVVIPREKNSAFSKKTTPGGVLRVTPLGSFNAKLAKGIKREIAESSDMEGNQRVRGSRSVEALSPLEGLHAQSSSPVQQKREKLTSGLNIILSKRHQRPNAEGQGKDAVQATPTDQGPNPSGGPSKKLSIDEYRNRHRKTAASQSQSSPSAASDVSSLTSDDSTNTQQPPAQGSSALFTRRRSVEQPVQVAPAATISLSSGSRNKPYFDGPQNSSSADVAYDRRPRGAVQAVDLTPPTGQLWASYNATLATPTTSTRPSLNPSVYLEAAPSARSISPSGKTHVGSSSEPRVPVVGRALVTQNPRGPVSAIVTPDSRTSAIEPPVSHASKNLNFQSSKRLTSENEILTAPNGDSRVNVGEETAQKSPITLPSIETRSTEHNQVQRKTLESNKENLDRAELCGLDFWNELIAEDCFTLGIPKMLISDDQIRRDLESMDFGERVFSEEEVTLDGAQTAASVCNVLPVEMNAEADSTPSEDKKSEELEQTEKESQSKTVNQESNRQENGSPSSQPHETDEQELVIGLEVAAKVVSPTEGSTEQMNTELLTTIQPDANTTANHADDGASHQDMEIDEASEVVASPSKVVEGSHGNEGKTDQTPSATNDNSKNEEIREILSKESKEIEQEAQHQNSGAAEIRAEDNVLGAENITQEQIPPTPADNLSSIESGSEKISAPMANKSPVHGESNLNCTESENMTAVPDQPIDNTNTATLTDDDGPLSAAAKLKSLMKARPDLYSKSCRSSKRIIPEESQHQAVSKRKRVNSEETVTAEVHLAITGVEDTDPSSRAPTRDISQHVGVINDQSLRSTTADTAITNSSTNGPSELQAEPNPEAVQSLSHNDYSELTISELLKDSKSVPKPSEEQPTVLASKLGVVANRFIAVPETQASINACKEVQCEIWKKTDICSSCNLACKKCSPVNNSRPSCYGPQECFPPNNEEGYRSKKDKLISVLKDQLKMLNLKLEKFQNETSETDPEGLLKGMTSLRRDVITCANLIDVNVIQFEQMRSKAPTEIAEVSTVNCEKMTIENMPGYLEILFLYDTYSHREEFKNHPDFRHLELFRYRALRTLKWKCKDNEEGSLLSIYKLLAKTNQGWSVEQLARCWDSVKQFRGELDTGAIEAEFNSTGDKVMLSIIAKIIKKMDADINRKKKKQGVTGLPSASGNPSAAGSVKVIPSTSAPSLQMTSSPSAEMGAPAHLVHHGAPGHGAPAPGNALVAEQLPFDAIRQSGINSQSVLRTGLAKQTLAPTQINQPQRVRSRTQLVDASRHGSNVSPVRPYPTPGGMAQIHLVPQQSINQGQYQSVLQQFVSSRSPSPAVGHQQQINLPPDVTVIPVGSHNPNVTYVTSQNKIYRHQQPMQRNAAFIHQVVGQNHQYQGNVVRRPSPQSHHVSVIAGNAASQVNRRSSGSGIHAENSQNVRANVPPTNQASTVNAQVFIDSLIESYFQDPNENH